MSFPAIPDSTSASKSHPKDALEIAIRKLLAARRRSARKRKMAGRARIRGDGDEREKNRPQPVARAHHRLWHRRMSGWAGGRLRGTRRRPRAGVGARALSHRLNPAASRLGRTRWDRTGPRLGRGWRQRDRRRSACLCCSDRRERAPGGPR